MNNTILSKILEELNKEAPRIDYVKGMLETLIEMQPLAHSSTAEHPSYKREVAGSTPAAPIEDGAVAGILSPAHLAEIKRLSDQGTA